MIVRNLHDEGSPSVVPQALHRSRERIIGSELGSGAGRATPAWPRCPPGSTETVNATCALPEDPARGNSSRLGGAIRSGQHERGAQERAQLGFELAIAFAKSLDLLVLPGLLLPDPGKLFLDLFETLEPSKNDVPLVLLQDDGIVTLGRVVEGQRLGEYGSHEQKVNVFLVK